MTDVRVPASRLMANVTMHVTVTGLTVFRVRMWLAFRLIALAARIAGCGLKVEGPA